ncbi:hypothetical protein FHT86_005588 [Rhizobium sp. BK313]|uniref:hypothetical protein n=1 Tax=Rhizobium sp. BK313 TaxID=2587081 RepID=UPI00105FD62F|nr:hypothetical protein [Rhizobium sp. BK313]MBB3457270.1 hypothetical protein [Rhizobium sp. BK313]
MTDLPWISEAKKHVGLQEVRDRLKLMAYFKTAGQNYDPSKTPWCGIFQATVFHSALPSQKPVVNPPPNYLTHFGQGAIGTPLTLI